MAVAVEKAYQAIREGILSGAYPSGAHLTARAIASTSSVSRTPVREAVRRLQAEGLVDVLPHRGAFVTTWNSPEIDEIFDLRVLLESRAAHLAVLSIKPQQLAELARLADEMEALVHTESPNCFRRIAQLNCSFHAIIVEASGSRRLWSLLSSLIEMPVVMTTFCRYHKSELLRSMGHHRELIAALEKRDGPWAGAVMTSHLLAARHVFDRSSSAIAG